MSTPDWTASWAVRSAGIYLLVTVLAAPLPFVRFPAFAFPDTGGEMAIPLFLADGKEADPTGFTAFSGFGPEAVDVAHVGLRSVVEHRFHELRSWIADHPGGGGAVQVSVGLRILRRMPDGTLRVEDRVDGTGTARPRE